MDSNEEGGGVWWLYLFLARSFFNACGNHENQSGNHQNRYCIDCDVAACQHCLSGGAHNDHRVISIYRLVHKDVVAQIEFNRHVDCSGIQPYASNGRQILSMHPLPHCNSGQLRPEHACITCTRKLMHPTRYSFCSIACKFHPENGKNPDNGNRSFPNGDSGNPNKSSKSGKTRRKKVLPKRSPFF